MEEYSMQERKRRWFLKAAGATVMTTTLAGCMGDGDDGNGDNGAEVVDIVDIDFEPAELTIETGTTVRWEWQGDLDHNVNPTSQPDDADWEGHTDLKADGDYEYTFEVAGTYEYTCDPHAGMDGTIIVE